MTVRRPLAFLLPLLFLVIATRRQDPLDLVIRHVNVVDVARGIIAVDQRIGVAKGRIASVTAESTTSPQAAVTVDVPGAFAIPGLWDMHAHLLEYPGVPSAAVPDVTLPLYLANGVIGVRDMGTPAFDTLEKRRDGIEAGAIAGPHLVITGRPLDGVPPTDWIKRPVADATEARKAVRDLKSAGADFVKVYERLSKAAYLAIAQESRAVGLPFAGHLPAAITPREAIEAGQRSIEHMGQGRLRQDAYGYLADGAAPPRDASPNQTAAIMRALTDAMNGVAKDGVWTAGTREWIASAEGKTALAAIRSGLGQISSMSLLRRAASAAGTDVAVQARHERGERSYKSLVTPTGAFDLLPDEPDIEQPTRVRALAALFTSHDTWLTPTLTPLSAIARRRQLLEHPDPRLAYVSAEVRRQLDPATDARYKNWTDVEWSFIARAYERDAQLAASLRHLGVRLLVGTDGVTDYCLPGFGVHDELQRLVDAGLTPLEALQAATLEPAEYLSRTNDFGAIAAGKIADLVLLNDSPLSDISHTTTIRGVIRGGRYLDRAALDRMLSRVRETLSK